MPLTPARTQKPVAPDAPQPPGHNMLGKPVEEIPCFQPHLAAHSAFPVVSDLNADGFLAKVAAQDPFVAQRDALSVARQVAHRRFRILQGARAMDYPGAASQAGRPLAEVASTLWFGASVNVGRDVI